MSVRWATFVLPRGALLAEPASLKCKLFGEIWIEILYPTAKRKYRYTYLKPTGTGTRDARTGGPSGAVQTSIGGRAQEHERCLYSSRSYSRSSYRTCTYRPALWDTVSYRMSGSLTNGVEIRSLWIPNLKYLEKFGSIWFRPQT